MILSTAIYILYFIIYSIRPELYASTVIRTKGRQKSVLAIFFPHIRKILVFGLTTAA
jgi:hypothetical protein